MPACTHIRDASTRHVQVLALKQQGFMDPPQPIASLRYHRQAQAAHLDCSRQLWSAAQSRSVTSIRVRTSAHWLRHLMLLM